MIDSLVGLCQAFILFCAAGWIYKVYYTGDVQLAEDKEIKRQEKKEKYGALIIATITVLSICGVLLLVSNLSKLLI